MGSKRRKRGRSANLRAGGEDAHQVIVRKPIIEQQFCSYCGEAINDIYQSLLEAETGKPVHFDCAFRRIKEKERLREGEVLTYLGSGRFAILDRAPGTGPFVIRKRIPFEDKESAAQWKKRISISI